MIEKVRKHLLEGKPIILFVTNCSGVIVEAGEIDMNNSLDHGVDAIHMVEKYWPWFSVKSVASLLESDAVNNTVLPDNYALTKKGKGESWSVVCERLKTARAWYENGEGPNRV